MTDKEKIRAEIERRIEELQPCNTSDNLRAHGAIAGYYQILSFIGSMQEEPASEELEEEIAQYFTTKFGFERKGDMLEIDKLSINVEDLLHIARHFANRQKRQDMKCGYITALQGEKRFANHILEMIEKGWHIEAVKTACKDKIKED